MSLLAAEVLGLVLGLLLGSFLNVCIVRVPRGESVMRPGSRCMDCGHAVRWYDNVPLLSWAVLRGRCRDCGGGFGWRYPLVELACGLWFALAGARLWHAWTLPAEALLRSGPGDSQVAILSLGVVGFAALGWLLIGLAVVDWRTQRLPDVFTLSGIALGLMLVAGQAIFLGPTEDQVVLKTNQNLRLTSPGSFVAKGNVFLTGPEALIFGRTAAATGAALLLLAVRWSYRRLRGREGVGLGDVKMLAMIAAFLGFWPALLTLFAATLLGSAWGLVLVARGRAGGLTRLPFGSFMGVAGLAVALAGEPVLAWYASLFR